jgi:1,4-dihydroxy-2-naphthoate octaprenyltransferase
MPDAPGMPGERDALGGGAYHPFSLKAAIELASPPTWAAALMPAVVGGALAIATGGVGFGEPLSLLRTGGAWLLVTLTALLLQAAANTLNDYHDFLNGTDTSKTVLDTSDASIVYNHIDPRDALRFGIGLLAGAAITGLAAVVLSSWILVGIGLVAAGVVVAYSAGAKPLSFLPLGEVLSGLVMGLFITFAAFYVVTLDLSAAPWVLLVCVVPVITIALIMQTNNTCDIERDIEAGRRTLPVLLGRARSQRLAQVLAWGTVAWMLLVSLLFWPLGVLVVLAVAVVLRQRLHRVATGPYNLENRRVMMGNATAFCYGANLAWAAAILSDIPLGGLL